MPEYEKIINVSEATFDEDVVEQSYDRPVVVDFWAPWCGPCRMLGPILERLAIDPAFDFVLAKVNVDENPNLAIRYGVRGIPAVKAFLNGDIAAEFVGAKPEPQVRKFVETLTPGASDALLNEGLSLLATHHWAEAEQAFRTVVESHPDDAPALLGLARALLAQGQGSEALGYLDRIRDGSELVSADRLRPLATYLRDFGDIDWLESEDESASNPIDRQYRRAALLLKRNNLEAAMDGLLDVLRENKRYRRSEPRHVLLALFELLGDQDNLTIAYRQELASVLF